jgi:general secretion pathway protein N
MEGQQMMRRTAIALALWMLALHGAAAATVAVVASDALDAGLEDEARLTGPRSGEPVTSVRIVPPPPAPQRTLSANPLWAIPLSKLSGTRERPIFSPSRRPPPPDVAAVPEAAPPPPPQPRQAPEPPPVSLVGTIAGGDESFGIFVDQSTKTPVRLKVGEDYQGWKLRTIQGREATLERDQQAAVLTLPPPGGESAGEVRMIPVSAVARPVTSR